MMAASSLPTLEFPVDFVATANSDMSVEERVEKMIEEKERRAMEAWIMMPRLFDVWDTDASGTLDKNEVFMGVEKYCDAREIAFDSRAISRLWAQVDDNGDGVLDRHEFAVFLARYCEAVGIALDDMAMVVLSQLAESAMDDQSSSKDEDDEEPESILKRLSMIGTRRPTKRASWAALKVQSEDLTQKPASPWEAMKLNLALKQFQQAKDSKDPTDKAEAAENLWKKLDNAMVERKKRLEHALSFESSTSSKKVAIPADSRKPPKRRHTSKIQAKSLDGFFSSVGHVIEKNKSHRESFTQATASTSGSSAEYNLSSRIE